MKYLIATAILITALFVGIVIIAYYRVSDTRNVYQEKQIDLLQEIQRDTDKKAEETIEPLEKRIEELKKNKGKG